MAVFLTAWQAAAQDELDPPPPPSTAAEPPERRIPTSVPPGAWPPDPHGIRRPASAPVNPSGEPDAPARRAKPSPYGHPRPSPWSGHGALRLAEAECLNEVATSLSRCQRALSVVAASSDGARAPSSRSQDIRARLEAHVSAWDSVQPRTLGVLLPLSGPHQRIGQAALEALGQAVAAQPGARLVVRDTGGDAEQAARMAEALVLEEGVPLVFGPVGRHECRAASAVTARYGVPHVMLGRDHELGGSRGSQVRARMSRVELARAVARYAVTDLNLRRVALLHPDTEPGRRAIAAFWDEFTRLGGTVRGVESYAADEDRFAGPLRRLLAASRPGQGTVDFDALFVPDDALRVRALVPHLRYWGVKVRRVPRGPGDGPGRATGGPVQLLGLDGWNDPAVVDAGERLTDNAVFVATYRVDPANAESTHFAEGFESRYGRAPTAFHAEVHDAARWVLPGVAAMPLMPETTEAAPDRDSRGPIGRRSPVPAPTSHAARLALWRVVLAPGLRRGATGTTTFTMDGQLVRRPHVMTVDFGTIRARRGELEEHTLRRDRQERLGADGVRDGAGGEPTSAADE